MRRRTFGAPVLVGIAVVVLLAACSPSIPPTGASHHRTRHPRVASSPTTSTTTSSTTTSSTTTSTSTTSTSTTTSTTAPPKPPSAVPADFVPESFTAVSTTQWWLLGHVSCGTGLCPAIVTTTDGGASFERLPAPGGAYSSSPSTTPPVSQIRFANPEDGWAFGTALYATQDGGQSWTLISLPGTVTDLEPGLDEVFAVVTPPTPACSRTGICTQLTPEPELWRSQPGSDVWQSEPAAGPVSGSLAVHGDSVWAVNAMFTKDGWVLGTGLVYSGDDGTQFSVEPQEIPGIVCNYQPVSDTDVWAYCSGGHFMWPYLSTDAGAHFAAVGSGDSPSDSPVGCSNGSGLIAASVTVAVASCNVPLGGPILRTDDGGSTWSAVQAGLNKNGWWVPVGFTTDLVGYAFWQQGFSDNSVQLWQTSDGGQTWSRVTQIP